VKRQLGLLFNAHFSGSDVLNVLITVRRCSQMVMLQFGWYMVPSATQINTEHSPSAIPISITVTHHHHGYLADADHGP